MRTRNKKAELWDACCCKKVRDKSIFLRDMRALEDFVPSKLSRRKSEVCGLKWSYDDRELASSDNDNRIFVWNQSSTQPVLRYSEYTAAVKAIAWSSHVHGLLAPEGGTADRCICFWNTTINSHLSCIDTGSQVSYIYGVVLCNVLDKERLEQNVKKKEERKHGLEEHGVIFTKPKLKPNGKKKEEEMEPRLEGQGVNFAKP